MPTFCDRCGAPTAVGDQRCRTCGWPVPVPLSPDERGEADRAVGGGTAGGLAGGSTGEHDDDPTPRATRPVGSAGYPAATAPTAPAGSTTGPGAAGRGDAAPWRRPETPYGVQDQQRTSAWSPEAGTGKKGRASDPGPGWAPAATGAYAVTTPEPTADEGGRDDRSAYGRWSLREDPELAQWREEPARDEAPARRPFGVVDDDRPSGARIAIRMLAGLAAAAVVVLVGLAVLFFGVLRAPSPSTPGVAVRPPSSPAVRPAPVTSTPAAPAPAPAPPTVPKPPSPTAAAFPAVAIPGRPCGANGAGPWAQVASGSSQTSCPFAMAVQQAYLASAPQAGQARTVSARSPVTGKAYPMTCIGNQPVTCSGGNGALVFLYGGKATFR